MLVVVDREGEGLDRAASLHHQRSGVVVLDPAHLEVEEAEDRRSGRPALLAVHLRSVAQLEEAEARLEGEQSQRGVLSVAVRSRVLLVEVVRSAEEEQQRPQHLARQRQDQRSDRRQHPQHSVG